VATPAVTGNAATPASGGNTQESGTPAATPEFPASPDPAPEATTTPDTAASPVPEAIASPELVAPDGEPDEGAPAPDDAAEPTSPATPAAELPVASPEIEGPEPQIGGDNTLTEEPVETPLPTPEPTQAVTAIGYVANTDGDGVNCRIGPGTDFDIVTWLAEGSELRLIGTPVDGWQAVICGDGSGYISAQFMSLEPPAAETPAPTATASPTNIPNDGPTSTTTPEATTQSLDPTATVQEEPAGEAPGEPVGQATPPSSDPAGDLPVTEPEPAAELTPTFEPTATVEPTLEPTPTLIPTLEPTPTPEPTVALVPVEREIVIPVTNDTSVNAANPDAVQSPEDQYLLKAGGEDENLAVLTFDVSGIGSAEVVSAQLVMTGAGDTGGAGGQLLAGPGVWFDETTTTWQHVANAAPWQYAWVDWVAPGSSAPVDVTSVVTSDGVISFVLVGTPEQQIAIASREQGNPAYIVVTVVEYLPPSS